MPGIFFYDIKNSFIFYLIFQYQKLNIIFQNVNCYGVMRCNYELSAQAGGSESGMEIEGKKNASPVRRG